MYLHIDAAGILADGDRICGELQNADGVVLDDRDHGVGTTQARPPTGINEFNSEIFITFQQAVVNDGDFEEFRGFTVGKADDSVGLRVVNIRIRSNNTR